ncbi:MAG: hypothetical protein O9340_00015 [Cyclobacteriaceae bacterium]|jgi:hypothetical protein|nr:hypothetical protein [Cyclobacteriaceae bacterium]
MEDKPAANKVLPKAGVIYYYDSSVLNQTLVFTSSESPVGDSEVIFILPMVGTITDHFLLTNPQLLVKEIGVCYIYKGSYKKI